MRDIIIVMKFTINEMLKRKSFIISTIIILLIIVIGFNIPNIIKAVGGEDISQKILIVDSENIFQDNLESLKKNFLNYKIEIEQKSFDEIKQKIENKEIDSAIIIEKQDNNLNYRYIIESKSITYMFPEDLINSITNLYSNIQVSKLGLTQEQLQEISPNIEINTEYIGKSAKGNVEVIMLMSIILFYAIYFCAYQVSTSITTEKTSKIMETLVTSTSPRTIVLGKTIGIGIVGIVQLILILVTAYINATICLDEEILNAVLDMSNITLSLGVITLIYFILGYFTYSLIYALTGSTVSKPEDIQSANSPVAILSVIGFYLAYFTMMNPSSELNFFASIFPLSSPFCMPFRIMMGLANIRDIIISILVLIVTILIIAKIAIRIYSNAILNYGTKISLKDFFNMYKE